MYSALAEPQRRGGSSEPTGVAWRRPRVAHRAPRDSDEAAPATASMARLILALRAAARGVTFFSQDWPSDECQSCSLRRPSATSRLRLRRLAEQHAAALQLVAMISSFTVHETQQRQRLIRPRTPFARSHCSAVDGDVRLQRCLPHVAKQ